MTVPVGGIDKEELDRLIERAVEDDIYYHKQRIITTNYDFNSDGSIVTNNTSYLFTNRSYEVGSYYPGSSLIFSKPSSESLYPRHIKFSSEMLLKVREAREHAEAAAEKAVDDPGMQWPPGKIFM